MLSWIKSLKYRLVLFILPLCLIPLIGISTFSYFVAKERITEDRIVLYLQQIASNVGDAIQLTILEKMEETVSMTLHEEFRDYITGDSQEMPVLLLDALTAVHEVYDLLILFDVDGRIMLTNSINRKSREFVPELLDSLELEQLEGESLLDFTPDSQWLQQVRSGRWGYIDWHSSPLVQRLYRYAASDIALQYSIGFAAPIVDERGIVVGGVLALMNWSFIQEILDKVEEDLDEHSLGSGYAFLFDTDQNTIIGHKYRRNRDYPAHELGDAALGRDNYGTRLVEDHQLVGLHEAVKAGEPFYEYEYPPGTAKISGLSVVNHEFFTWVCGVGINNADIFSPVQELKTILITAASLSILLVIFLTFSLARNITIPLKELTMGARVIAEGDLSQRVHVQSRDELGQLARSFNEMASSLEERSRDLIDLTRRLEEKVKERTSELEQANSEIRRAYEELKETQFQLVQTEKLASLGQLMAGIAHEIKNPLNFIYGNTGFLRTYIERIRNLVSLYEEKGRLDPQARSDIESFKESVNYEFLLEDLESLISNFEEGAKRIHDIIADLRTFSRMEADEIRSIDLHDQIELALSLLQNEYRGRIEVIKDFGDLPGVQCHPGRLNQVFMNLLLNACQAIPEQGEIRIKTRHSGDEVTVEIEDNGEGIRTEDLDRIFEPFFTTKPVGKGTGLGLSISFSIIQQHHGKIEVESSPGQGTRFSIRLPVKQ